jgi:ribonuclease J
LAAKKTKLRVTALGGLGEIGKNMTVLEYGGDLIIVDCGVAFPQDDMLGIDLVIPDFTYLANNRGKIRGVLLTHAHEDHIGSVPYFLRDFKAPIYGTKLTLGLVGNKLKEHGLTERAEMHVVATGEKFTLGCFKIEFINTTHSIADSVALAIDTPVGMVIHSGDFKVDYTPIQGKPIDLQRFAELGKEGVRLFLCESTNVEEKGYTMSERVVGDIFEGIFDHTPNQRIMVATFSSNIHRIQQVLNSAVKHRRKVLILGRSMVNAVKTASELGYLNIPTGLLIEASEIKNYDDRQLVIITTGSQGEPMAALSRMAAADHRTVDVKPGDKIIISASPIPGNEKMISRVINELMKQGADVIYEGLMDVHVSGHAKQEEIKLLHALIKPKYLMPIHGEYRHLIHHKELAVSMGMSKDSIFVMDIGEVLEVSDKTAVRNGTVPSGQLLVDGLGIGDVGSVVLRDRKHLAEDGLIIAAAGVSFENGGVMLMSGPEIISRGFVFVREADDLIENAKAVVRGALYECEQKNTNDWQYIRNKIKDDLKEHIWQKTKRNPMIFPVLLEV